MAVYSSSHRVAFYLSLAYLLGVKFLMADYAPALIEAIKLTLGAQPTSMPDQDLPTFTEAAPSAAATTDPAPSPAATTEAVPGAAATTEAGLMAALSTGPEQPPPKAIPTANPTQAPLQPGPVQTDQALLRGVVSGIRSNALAKPSPSPGCNITACVGYYAVSLSERLACQSEG